jgi:quercetin dioxygenase-like cupin family protein
MTREDNVKLNGRAVASGLQIVRWAVDLGVDEQQLLGVGLGPRPLAVAGSSATGEPLLSNGQLGADIIRLAAGEGFAPHTHPGDHLLLVVGGLGAVTCAGTIHPTHPGELLMIDGAVPHAVGAITDHVILAIGSPHRSVDALDRMTPVEYQAVTADIDDLHCLICDRHARYPAYLHQVGCPHCPCSHCHYTPAREGNGP